MTRTKRMTYFSHKTDRAVAKRVLVKEKCYLSLNQGFTLAPASTKMTAAPSMLKLSKQIFCKMIKYTSAQVNSRVKRSIPDRL